MAGTIAAVGPGVSHLQVGQQAGLGWHSIYCITRPAGMSGDLNLGGHAPGTIVSRHGGSSDKVRAHAASVVALPKNIDVQSAGPLFCSGITVFNPLIQSGVKPTDRVAVIGIGGLGQMALQFLNVWAAK